MQVRMYFMFVGLQADLCMYVCMYVCMYLHAYVGECVFYVRWIVNEPMYVYIYG